jgi:hypothetical protein
MPGMDPLRTNGPVERAGTPTALPCTCRTKRNRSDTEAFANRQSSLIEQLPVTDGERLHTGIKDGTTSLGQVFPFEFAIFQPHRSHEHSSVDISISLR